ncbi:hypothetical protein C3L33_04746, partial [Rhododendron williamsianum]
MIIQPGPVVDFLIAYQNVKDPFQIDWAKVAIFRLTVVTVAKRTLKNLRIKTNPANTVFKISGLSERPCKEQINVGKPKRPTYFPLELCSLVSLQRYTKSLSTFQRSSLVEKLRHKPQERMRVLTDALKVNNYDAEPMLCSCGVSINNNFTQVEGRVLPAPKLKGGNGEDFFSRNGRWNFNNQKFVEPATLERWAVVNFSARSDVRGLIRDLTRIGESKGILGGLNSLLSVEGSPSMPLISKVHTMIIGMDVSHGSPGQSDVPSIAAVFSSRNWPFISRYWASVRTQSPEVEMIDSLYKRNAGTVIDNKVCHPRGNDFYLCAHAGMIISVLLSHPGLPSFLCWQLLRYVTLTWRPLRWELLRSSKNSQRHPQAMGGLTSAGPAPVPQLPKLQATVCSSMFFC